MSKKNVVRMGLVLCMALLLVAVPLIGACAPKAEAPPTEKPETPAGIPSDAVIKVAEVCDLTGPYGWDGICPHMGVTAYVKYVNSIGGIGGIPVEHLWEDCRNEPPAAVSAFRGFADEGALCVKVHSTGIFLALKPKCEETQIPEISGPSGMIPTVDPPGWAYCIHPLYIEEMCGFFDWMNDQYKGNPPKVGILAIDNPFGYAVTVPEMYDYASNAGIEIVSPEAPEYMAAGSTDATIQLRRLADAGAEVIWCQVIGNMLATITRDAERLGLRDKMEFVGFSLSLTDELLKLAGPSAEGIKSPWFWASWDDNLPEMKSLQEWIAKENKGTFPHNMHAIIGWQDAKLMCGAIEMAMENEGYPVTGAAVKEALDSMKDFDMGGIIEPVTFGSQRRVGTYREKMIEIQGGTQVPISDWFDVPQIAGKDYWNK